MVESEDLAADQVLNIPVDATALVPGIRMDPEAITFGDCTIGERKDVVLTIKNTHSVLPVNFYVPQLPNFRCIVFSLIIENSRNY